MKKSMTLLLAGMMLLGMVTVANATTISYVAKELAEELDDIGTMIWPSEIVASDTVAVGQTFNLSEEDIDIGDDNFLDLDSVTFWITGDIEFKFYLYEWDGANVRIIEDQDNPLFESDQMSTTESGVRE